MERENESNPALRVSVLSSGEKGPRRPSRACLMNVSTWKLGTRKLARNGFAEMSAHADLRRTRTSHNGTSGSFRLIQIDEWCHNDAGLATVRVNCSVLTQTALGPKKENANRM